jgi:heme A synthase
MLATLVTSIVRAHRDDRRLVRLALLATVLVGAQIALGALILWTHRAVLPTTTHLVVGAGLLATCLGITLEAGRAPVPAPQAHDLPHAVPA